ncbi:MAG: class I SAM-dependent methyltransferase [Firmicutes bacterium]|nr:class I SAM-dependent methyltransferase [Bacillota bacterium]
MNENWKEYYEKEAEYLRFIPSEDILENHRVRLVMKLFLSAMTPSSIIDIGCGDGYLCSVFKLKGINKVAGMDISAKRVEFSRKTFPGIEFFEGSVYSIPVEDNSFDLVTAVEILEHIEKPADAVAELKRISRKYLLATVPDSEILLDAACPHCLKTFKINGHLNSFNETSFKKIFEEAGFKIVKLKKYTFTSFFDRFPLRLLPSFIHESLKDFAFKNGIIKKGNYLGILAEK